MAHRRTDFRRHRRRRRSLARHRHAFGPRAVARHRPLLHRLPQRRRSRRRRVVQEHRSPLRREQREDLRSAPCASCARASCRRKASRAPSARCSMPRPAGSSTSSTPPRRVRRTPAPKPLARLNRTEYANAIRDLLDYEPGAVAASLPADVSVGGFDNIAAALAVSPTLLEGYALAAHADRPPRRRRSLDGPQRGPLCSGRRGGAAAPRRRPAARHARRPCRRAHVSARRANTSCPCRPSCPPRAGTIRRASSCGATARASTSRSTARPRARRPIARAFACACRPGRNASRPRSSTTSAAPASTSSTSARSSSAARSRASTIDGPLRPDRRRRHAEPPRDLHLPARVRGRRGAVRAADSRRASRRARIAIPSTPAGDELEPLIEFYRLGRDEGGDFEVGIQYALSRAARRPAASSTVSSASRESVRRRRAVSHQRSRARVAAVVLPLEQHSRRRAAAAGRERHAAATRRCSTQQVRAHARRSALAARSSRTSRASGSSCASSTDFVRRKTRTSTTTCARRSAERRSCSSQTCARAPQRARPARRGLHVLNERLAQHYGIDGVRGSYMRRVALPADSPRRGLLGQGSILTVDVRAEPHVARRARPMDRARTCSAPRCRPRRRAWPPIFEGSDGGRELVRDTVRERLEMHRANPTCAACHADHGSARLRARELRSRRPLARSTKTATRSTRPAQ